MNESGEGLRVAVGATPKMFVHQTSSLLLIPLLKEDTMDDFDVTANDVGEFGGKW